MSQQELADMTGTGQKTISAIENGHEGTKLEIIFRLLAAMELEIGVSRRGIDIGKSIGDVF